MTRRLVGSRQTEEMVRDTWHCAGGHYLYGIGSDAWKWLESDEMQGRWCAPASGVGTKGIMFELEEDRVMFMLKWG